MNFTIRPATADDISAMHRVRMAVRENRLSRNTRVTEDSYRQYIEAGSAWVAGTAAGIVGFAALDVPARNVWALFVDPVAEGSGIGRALHDAMLDWARNQGLERLSLSTEDGSRAMRFYSRAGWTCARVTADREVHFETSLRG